MSPSPSSKGEWRQWFSEKRRSYPLAQAQMDSAEVCRRLVALIRKRCPLPAAVSLYLPIRGEVDVTEASRLLEAAGYKCLLPRLTPQGMDFAPITGPQDLVAGPFGLTEPKQDLLAVRPQVVVLPGLGFSRDFHRLGYGKGHYDRVLQNLGGALTIGVGFSFQLVDHLPVESHDQQLDAVVTPDEAHAREVLISR